MKGRPTIVRELNRLLTGELTAADQYFIHSRMYENWGLRELFQRVEHERVEELDHATRLIRRILFLEGIPDVASREPLKIGATVPEMLKNDLNYEYAVVGALRKAIAICETQRDYETRRILGDLLEDTETDHAYWLEIQLGLIEKIGLHNYLQTAVGKSSPNA